MRIKLFMLNQPSFIVKENTPKEKIEVIKENLKSPGSVSVIATEEKPKVVSIEERINSFLSSNNLDRDRVKIHTTEHYIMLVMD